MTDVQVSIEESLKKAEGLSISGQHEEALILLDKLNTEGEQGGLICFIRGNVYLRKGQLESAQKWYGESLKKGYVSDKLFMNFGKLKQMLHKSDEAIDMYRQAFQLEPTDITPLNNIVQICLQWGDYQEASKNIFYMMEMFPELFEGFHHHADMLLGTEKYAEALDFLQSYEERFSSNTLYIYDKARALKGVGKLQEALDYLSDKEQKFEDTALYFMYRKMVCELQFQLGQYNEAVPYLIELFDKYDDKDAALKLVVMSFEKKEYELAYEIAERLMAISKTGRSYYIAAYFRAIAFDALELKEKAMDAYQSFLTEIYELKECPYDLLGFRFQVEYRLRRESEMQITLQLLEEQLEHVAGDEEAKERVRQQIEDLRTMLQEKADNFC